MGQRVNLCILLFVDAAETCQCVDSIDIHGTATTDTLSARSTEGQTRIHLIFDFDQCIKDHGTAGVQVHIEGLQVRLLLWLVGVLSRRVSSSV